MRDLVRIEYHPPCTFYGEEGCIEQTGEYECACGASTAWHKTEPVEIDYEAADQAAIPMAHRIIFKDDVIAIVNAALGIGGDDE
jgi:hypothetical protein